VSRVDRGAADLAHAVGVLEEECYAPTVPDPREAVVAVSTFESSGPPPSD
jgi:hypothetical protein